MDLNELVKQISDFGVKGMEQTGLLVFFLAPNRAFGTWFVYPRLTVFLPLFALVGMIVALGLAAALVVSCGDGASGPTITVVPPPVPDNLADYGLGSGIVPMLIALAVGALKEEPDHRVVEATVDEIVHDRAQLRFPAELFEQAH